MIAMLVSARSFVGAKSNKLSSKKTHTILYIAPMSRYSISRLKFLKVKPNPLREKLTIDDSKRSDDAPADTKHTFYNQENEYLSKN